MELDAGDRAPLDGGDDPAVVIGDSDHDVIVDRLDSEAVGEVDVVPVEAVDQHRPPRQGERVPAHVRHRSGSDTPHGAREKLESAAALVAATEEELHADAD